MKLSAPEGFPYGRTKGKVHFQPDGLLDQGQGERGLYHKRARGRDGAGRSGKGSTESILTGRVFRKGT